MSMREKVKKEDRFHGTLLALVKTAGAIDRVANEFFSAHNLTSAQFNVLWVLRYSSGALTQVDIGKQLVVSRANVTAILDRLEEKTLVQRKSTIDDRRVYHISLTPKGVETVD